VWVGEEKTAADVKRDVAKSRPGAAGPDSEIGSSRDKRAQLRAHTSRSRNTGLFVQPREFSRKRPFSEGSRVIAWDADVRLIINQRLPRNAGADGAETRAPGHERLELPRSRAIIIIDARLGGSLRDTTSGNPSGPSLPLSRRGQISRDAARLCVTRVNYRAEGRRSGRGGGGGPRAEGREPRAEERAVEGRALAHARSIISFRYCAIMFSGDSQSWIFLLPFAQDPAAIGDIHLHSDMIIRLIAGADEAVGRPNAFRDW
jgi:hypothetical protein